MEMGNDAAAVDALAQELMDFDFDSIEEFIAVCSTWSDFNFKGFASLYLSTSTTMPERIEFLKEVIISRIQTKLFHGKEVSKKVCDFLKDHYHGNVLCNHVIIRLAVSNYDFPDGDEATAEFLSKKLIPTISISPDYSIFLVKHICNSRSRPPRSVDHIITGFENTHKILSALVNKLPGSASTCTGSGVQTDLDSVLYKDLRELCGLGGRRVPPATTSSQVTRFFREVLKTIRDNRKMVAKVVRIQTRAESRAATA
ncbi:hypothetical protein QBC38DRAFT_451834 [Podospora fimiseda]|uniref:Uncharacterized protein n=1 Tax=Podospora fimiseda TaxID=252190 RepID=A0AAN7BWE0_9PEZI|nr:hypothetical protein QBC38DRAFT_451834 [Podospora fimiseda]